MNVPRTSAPDPNRAGFMIPEVWVLIVGGVLTGGFPLVCIALAAWKHSQAWLSFAVPAVGISLFLGVAMLGHYTAPDLTIGQSAMRSGLAAGLVGAALTVLGFSIFEKNGAADAPFFDAGLVKNLTKWVSLVVGFYFASTTASDFLKSKKKAAGAHDADREPGSDSP